MDQFSRLQRPRVQLCLDLDPELKCMPYPYTAQVDLLSDVIAYIFLRRVILATRQHVDAYLLDRARYRMIDSTHCDNLFKSVVCSVRELAPRTAIILDSSNEPTDPSNTTLLTSLIANRELDVDAIGGRTGDRNQTTIFREQGLPYTIVSCFPSSEMVAPSDGPLPVAHLFNASHVVFRDHRGRPRLVEDLRHVVRTVRYALVESRRERGITRNG